MRFVSRRSKKVGMSPGTLVHVGEKRTEAVCIELLNSPQSFTLFLGRLTVSSIVCSPGLAIIFFVSFAPSTEPVIVERIDV